MVDSVINISRHGQKIFFIGCACVGGYVAYRYWKKLELRAIDEGFDEITKVKFFYYLSKSNMYL